MADATALGITSPWPVKAWHTDLNAATLADAIPERVVHGSHEIELKTSRSLRDTSEGAPATAWQETPT